MAKLDNAFDSDQHDDMNDSFEPMPKGIYLCQITDSDWVTTKDGTGKFVKLEFTVLDGEFKGRKVWTNLNLKNRNPVAVEIAQKEFATICRCCKKPKVQDTAVLHGIPLYVKIVIKPAKDDYPASNTPKGYKPYGVQDTEQGNAFAAEQVVTEKVKKQKKLTKGSESTDEPEGEEIPWG